MKASAPFSLIILIVTVATLLHECKVKKPDKQDKVMNALEGVKKVVPQGRSISLRTEPSMSELAPWARYALAPRFLDINKGQDRFDTALSIQYAVKGDSGLIAWVYGRKVLWQYKDSQFVYRLTSAQ